MEKNYRVTVSLYTYKVQGKAITQKDPEMSRIKAQQILDTPNTVQLYVLLKSELSQLEKIKLSVPGGKKSLETVFQAQQCLQRGQSSPV